MPEKKSTTRINPAKDADESSLQIRTTSTADVANASVDKLEEYIIKGFYEEKVQQRIREHLKKIIGEELSKISQLLRHSLREWVFKEKQKNNLDFEAEKRKLLTEKLEDYRKKNQDLENQNLALKRRLKLKEHENQIVLESLKKTMDRRTK